jgi:Cupin domain
MHRRHGRYSSPTFRQSLRKRRSSLPSSLRPGQALPWHVHPDGHELVYVLEGALTVEDQNHKITVTKAGEVNHVAPNVGHTARNDGTTAKADCRDALRINVLVNAFVATARRLFHSFPRQLGSSTDRSARVGIFQLIGSE